MTLYKSSVYTLVRVSRECEACTREVPQVLSRAPATARELPRMHSRGTASARVPAPTGAR